MDEGTGATWHSDEVLVTLGAEPVPDNQVIQRVDIPLI